MIGRRIVSFHKKRILNAAQRAEYRVMRRIGAFIMTTARQSIKGKKTSRPGSPPARGTGFMKRKIRFDYDANRQSTLIGPIADGKSRGDVTEALEHGGTTLNEGRGHVRGTTQRIRARPFMGPALEKNIPKLSELWRDSIH